MCGKMKRVDYETCVAYYLAVIRTHVHSHLSLSPALSHSHHPIPLPYMSCPVCSVPLLLALCVCVCLSVCPSLSRERALAHRVVCLLISCYFNSSQHAERTSVFSEGGVESCPLCACDSCADRRNRWRGGGGRGLQGEGGGGEGGGGGGGGKFIQGWRSELGGLRARPRYPGVEDEFNIAVLRS